MYRGGCKSQGLFIGANTLLLAIFVTTFVGVHTGISSCIVDDVDQNILKRLDSLKGKKLTVPVSYLVDSNPVTTTFEFSICTSVSTTGDSGAQQKTGDTVISFGKITDASVSSEKNTIYLSYHNGDDSPPCKNTTRTSALIFVCDPDTELGDMRLLEKYNKDIPRCSYSFEVGSRHACTVKDGLSGGSIFCILFFTGITIYLLLGFLYQRLVVGAKGLEQIPNYSFWRDFGNLQADGCDFLCRCGPRQEAHSYRGIDERLPRDEERDDQLLNM